MAGCGSGSPTQPSDAPKGAQQVDIFLYDALDLIESIGSSRPLSGARIETVAGPLVGTVATAGGGSAHFYMNRPPHTLRGTAYRLPAGTAVRIFDGPNAGRTTTVDAQGLYRFDGLLRSSPFRVAFGNGQEVVFSNQNSGERLADFVHHAWLEGPR